MTGFADRRLNQLGYACRTVELRAGIEPAFSPWHSDVIPLDQRSTQSRMSNLELRRSNRARHRIRNPKYPKSEIRNSFWCWRKESNLHQTGFEPVTSADWVTPAQTHALRINLWYRRKESNPHQLVSKTSASARLGYAGTILSAEQRVLSAE